MMPSPHAHPVLTCKQARELEPKILVDMDAEWHAMKAAGGGVAEAVIRDYNELFVAPDHLRVLALIGKGNNAGDALIACGHLLAQFPRASVRLLLSVEIDNLKPLAKRAYDELEGRVRWTVLSETHSVAEVADIFEQITKECVVDICIDGLLGVSFVPPLRNVTHMLIEAANSCEKIRLRASVDLPSGRGDLCDDVVFRADFTYATGIAKKPLFEGIADCGRVRYVDLGFFDCSIGAEYDAQEHILQPRVLAPLQKFRPADVDKRKFGHLFIVGGSAFMPGALLMAVKAAVQSGVGLVTAFAPASVAAILSVQVPEAIWVPWPETSKGTLKPRAFPLIMDRLDAATAVLCGPGMGRDRSTEMLAQEIVKEVRLPVILDADALRRKVIELIPKRKPDFGPVVLTPHMGEFMRIAKLAEPDYQVEALLASCRNYKALTVLKGANTRICDGESVLYNTHGGPVLARGGSGDLLSGLISGMVAQGDVDTQTAVARGVMLHGLAAQRLARDKGQVMVNTTQLLEYLPDVLRNDLG